MHRARVANARRKAGGRKSRVLRQALAHSAVPVRLLSPAEESHDEKARRSRQGEKLFVVNDAHDRDDLPLLMRYAADHANRAWLLHPAL